MKQLKQNDAGTKKTEVCGMTKDQMIELMERLNKGRKDNIESHRRALNILVGAIPVGGKVFAIIYIILLFVEENWENSNKIIGSSGITHLYIQIYVPI